VPSEDLGEDQVKFNWLWSVSAGYWGAYYRDFQYWNKPLYYITDIICSANTTVDVEFFNFYKISMNVIFDIIDWEPFVLELVQWQPLVIELG